MNKPFIVGVTGGSASGKTLFLKSLVKSFAKEDLCLVSQDEYFKRKEDQPIDEKGISNFDTPFSIDADQFAADIKLLRQGETVLRKEYTFNNLALTPRILTFKPAPVIIVEGIFVFYYPEIAKLFDLKIFIDAREHIKLTRRIVRDKDERGYGIEDVLYRYEKHVAPTYQKYIKPFKHEADFVIPNNLHFDKALEVITVFLKTKIA
jgi:uridine kinase